MSTRSRHAVQPMKRLLATLMLVATCTVPATALAANQYVRADATGNNSGTDWLNAYTALPKTLTRGDTYYLGDGIYPGRSFGTKTQGATLITIKKATVADHGTSAGWNDAYGDEQAIFTGGLAFTSSHWLLDGQTGGGAVNNWGGVFGIKIAERRDEVPLIKIADQNVKADQITIRHVELHGKGSASDHGGSFSNDGLAIYGATGVTLSYFRMVGIGRGPFFVSPRKLVVEHGWVESFYGSSDVHSEVASIWGFAGNVGNVTFRHNLFTDIQSTGGIMWDNSSNPRAKLSIYGNVFYKPPGAHWQQANGLIGGWTGGNGEEFHNVAVYNNTFINVDQESLSSFPNVFSGNVAFNNFFYNCRSPDFAKFQQHDNNHFINSGGKHSEPGGTSAASGDPFVEYPDFDFHLKVGTAAGATLPEPLNIDASGVVRGLDGVWDRGAFEFSAGGAGTFAVPTKEGHGNAEQGQRQMHPINTPHTMPPDHSHMSSPP